MSKQSFREKRLEKLEGNLLTQLKDAAFEDDNLTAEQAYDLPDEAFQPAPYNETEAERIGYSNYSYWRSTFQMFLKNRLAASLLIVIAVIMIFAFIQPYIHLH